MPNIIIYNRNIFLRLDNGSCPNPAKVGNVEYDRYHPRWRNTRFDNVITVSTFENFFMRLLK